MKFVYLPSLCILFSLIKHNILANGEELSTITLSDDAREGEDHFNTDTASVDSFVSEIPTNYSSQFYLRRSSNPNLAANIGGTFEVFANTLIPAIHLFLASPTKMHCVNRREPDPQKVYPQGTDMTTEIDLLTGSVRTIKLSTGQPGCSSGAFTSDGKYVMTGQTTGADKKEYMKVYDGTSWIERFTKSASYRWYGTVITLPAGNLLLLGGALSSSVQNAANNPTYEYYPNPNMVQYNFDFLKQTATKKNVLYSFAYVLPDGNIFVMADTECVVWNPYTNTIVKTLPKSNPAHRNYPQTSG
eukprot:gene8532-11532_t